MKRSIKRTEMELSNCTFVKSILMITVVLYHSCVFWTGLWFTRESVAIEAPGLEFFSNFLGTFHIYGFALVSGYIFQYIKFEKKGYQIFKEFLEKKIKRLIVPYIFTAGIWVVPISILLCSNSLKEIFNSYILCTSPSQLWFLWMLFDVFVIVWPISNWIQKDIRTLLVATIAWMAGTLGSASGVPNVFCIWTALSYVSFFVIGMKLRQKKNCNNEKMLKLIASLSFIVLFILSMLLNARVDFLSRALALCVNFLLHICGAIVAFLLLQYLANRVKWAESKAFLKLSDRMMPMYLIHQQVIYFSIILLNGKINPYMNALVNFGVAMIISYVISGILLKFKVTRFLIGQK